MRVPRALAVRCLVRSGVAAGPWRGNIDETSRFQSNPASGNTGTPVFGTRSGGRTKTPRRRRCPAAMAAQQHAARRGGRVDSGGPIDFPRRRIGCSDRQADDTPPSHRVFCGAEKASLKLRTSDEYSRYVREWDWPSIVCISDPRRTPMPMGKGRGRLLRPPRP